jgi:hypothetical protein
MVERIIIIQLCELSEDCGSSNRTARYFKMSAHQGNEYATKQYPLSLEEVPVSQSDIYMIQLRMFSLILKVSRM